MIKVGKHKVDIDSNLIEQVNNRILDNTIRTNLNPNFLLRKNYAGGHIDQVFVGNWTSDGLWIAYDKFILPMIVARIKMIDNNNTRTYDFTYYIGFSSIFMISPFIFFITYGFIKISILAFILSLLFTLVIYAILVVDAKEEIKKKINEKIFLGLAKKNNSQPTTKAKTNSLR